MFEPVGQQKFNTNVDSYINVSKQERHIFGGKGNEDKGYFHSLSDAQDVLQAYQRGETTVLGQGTTGGDIVRYEGVTGYNVNKNAGFFNQPTNVFLIKGSSSTSVVPVNPKYNGGKNGAK